MNIRYMRWYNSEYYIHYTLYFMYYIILVIYICVCVYIYITFQYTYIYILTTLSEIAIGRLAGGGGTGI